MRRTLGTILALCCTWAVVPNSTAFALSVQEKTSAKKEDAKAEEGQEEGLTLERLFPEKSVFGPSARSMAFSSDGRYGAWLWRPRIERRHGSDLWIHDFQTGETTRVTSATVFEPFQKQAREVVRDREKKAKKRAAKKKEEKDGKAAEKDAKKGKDEKQDKDGKKDVKLGDQVDEDDAEDEDAPRYGGVSSFDWSPVKNELLLSAGGDVYRLKMGKEGLERLTSTREREGGVQWLPDGAGFLYQDGSDLMRVSFGSHLVEQIDPSLEDGFEVSGWDLSPDGLRIALVANKGRSGFGAGGRTVNIADYGDRFMTVREVPRHMSDDPFPEYDSAFFIYELPPPMEEEGELYELHRFHHSGPRDVVRTPDWAPDSSRVCFATFQQENSQVEVLEAVLPQAETEQVEPAADGEKLGWDDLVAAAKKGEKDVEEGEEQADEEEEDADEDEDVRELPAKVVYRFLHAGGPDTPRMVAPRYTADSRHIAFITEQSGFRHLGLLNPLYEHLEPLTRGAYEVYLAQVPEHRKWLFVTATKEHPAQLDVYKVDLEGEMTRLTSGVGRFDRPAVSPGGEYVLANISAYGRLRELVAVDTAKGTLKELTQSHTDEAREITQVVPTLFDFENRHGHRIHGMLMKPADMKQGERRPCLMYVYGGPLGTRKDILQGNYSSSAYLFARYMTEVHGFVTATIDPRGMSGYGAVFEKANFEQAGKPQVEDLVDGARFLVEKHGVDEDRIGLHGWSFGGFQTQMCLYSEPDVFACGIAGAGPTEWENYNSWYSTGTIGPSRKGETDLEKYSLLPLAKNLKSRLLLVHGMEDSNVLYQDTVRVYAALLEADKETLVELFLDPSGGHGLGGHVKRLNRYRKYEEFLLRCLTDKDPLPAKPKPKTKSKKAAKS